jgi:hypothetical protein
MSDDTLTHLSGDGQPEAECPQCGILSEQLGRLGPTLEFICPADDCRIQMFSSADGVLDRFEGEDPPHLFVVDGDITDAQRRAVKDCVAEVLDG